MNKTWVSLGAMLAIAALSYVGYRWLQPVQLPAGFLYGNGHIEGTPVRVSAETGGRVLRIAMEEGSNVSAGQALAEIDPLITAETLEAAQAELKMVDKELAAVRAQLGSARHHADNAQKDLARFQILRQSGAVSQVQLDAAANVAREAKGHVDHFSETEAGLNAKRAAAQAKIAMASDRNAKTSVVAPLGGTLLVKAVEAGEYVQPGQVIAEIVDMQRLELRVFISEKQLGLVKLNSDARVRVNAFPDRYFDARVSRVDQQGQFTPRDIHLPDERERTVYGVTLSLANPDQSLKPGMPADAWIRWQSDAPWPVRLVVPGQ